MSYKNAQSKAATEYNKRSSVAFTVRLNIKTDADIIAALETVNNRNALIKSLLRQAIADSETGAAMKTIKKSDSGVIELFDWFSANFPRCEMVIKNVSNGFIVRIKETSDSGEYYGQKTFVFGADYTTNDNIFDLIRAAIPEIIEGIKEYKKTIADSNEGGNV